MPPSQPLSQEQLKRLDEHRYNSAGSSLLEPLMQHFWEWLLRRLPPWVAPNLITVLGLAVNALTTLLLVWHCPTATERAPLWVYLTCAAGLFLYQSLDAIDGKQARRTASSTALGELFDHGCDALSTVFVVLGTCVSAQLGTHPDAMFFCCFAAMAMFYLAHWQTYVLGTLRCGSVDVTEVQMFIIGVHLAAAFGGPALWQSALPLPPLPSPLVAGLLGQDAADGGELPAKMAPLLVTMAGALFSASGYLRVIFAGGVGKNRSTTAGSSVLGPLFHIGMVLALATAVHKKSPTRLFERHPCLYVLAFGFVSAKVTSKLMVAHITKSEMQLADWAFLGPGLLVLNQYFNSVLDEHLLLWAALLLSALDLLRYSVSVCNQIAAHLDISVFKLKPIGGLASPAVAPLSNSGSEYATSSSSSSSRFGDRNQRGDGIPATRYRWRSGRP